VPKLPVWPKAKMTVRLFTRRNNCRDGYVCMADDC
jgi:hypothetical protein